MKKIEKFYRHFSRTANWLRSPFLLAIRLYWGWQFFETGWGKLHKIPHVTEFFHSLHIPLPGANAWFVSILECVGGLLLLAGFGSRIIAFLLAFDMVIAYVTADSAALKAIFTDSDKFVHAAPFPFLLMTLTVLAFGAGAFSLDWLIARKYFGKKPAA